jgi:hypothetical protein
MTAPLFVPDQPTTVRIVPSTEREEDSETGKEGIVIEFATGTGLYSFTKDDI